jgi:hypothetical protein
VRLRSIIGNSADTVDIDVHALFLSDNEDADQLDPSQGAERLPWFDDREEDVIVPEMRPIGVMHCRTADLLIR